MKTPTTHQTRLGPAAAFLGGVAASRLRVYEGCAPDRLGGGSPHLHLVCAEAYLVLTGTGSVELLSLSDGYQCLDLRPGDAVQFDPGVVHRLVNDGELEILVLMQNAGLPENGDAVFTFPPDILNDVAAYRRHAAIDSLETALERRDLAVDGMMLLKDGFARSFEDGRRLLGDFHRRATELASRSSRTWLDIVDRGPGAAVTESRGRVQTLLSGQPANLASAQVSRVVMSAERLGMCGWLNPLVIDGTATVERPQARICK